jgi:hypothetical protein
LRDRLSRCGSQSADLSKTKGASRECSAQRVWKQTRIAD